MCKATVVYEEKLGKRREGWCVYLNKSRDFTFYSDKQVKSKIEGGEQINGLTVSEAGEVVMDEAFTTALLSKSGLTTFTPIREDESGSLANKYYALVRVVRGRAGNRYELVTNRCGVCMEDEERLKAMLSLIEVGGVRMDEKGQLVLHEGVEVEEVTEGQSKAKGASKVEGAVG